MSDLPESWECATVGEIATVQLGRQRSPKNHTGAHMRPYLRSANVTWRGISIADVKEMNFNPDEAATFELRDGDILLNEASGSPGEVGKPAIWRNEIPGACFQNTLLRVRSAEMDEGFLYWYFYNAAFTGRFGEAGRGVNIRHLGKQGLASFPIPIPPLPEQRRIVAAIEEHFSRLDAAEAQISRVDRAQPWLRRTFIDQAIDALGSGTAKVGDVLQVLSGRTFPSDSYRDDGILLLRPGNLHSSGAVVWSTSATRYLPTQFASQYPKYHLSGRRLLMNLTAQSLADEFLGRVCLTADQDQFLLNQRIADLSGPDYLPDFLFYVFRSSRFRRFVDSLNTGSLIQHISTKQLVDFTIPVVPLETQKEVALRLSALAETAESASSLANAAARRAAALRRAILAVAFSGRFVPQDPTDEPASVLLERITTERAASRPSRRKRAAS